MDSNFNLLANLSGSIADCRGHLLATLELMVVIKPMRHLRSFHGNALESKINFE